LCAGVKSSDAPSLKPQMPRTPKLHFDTMLRRVPELAAFYEIMKSSHARISNEQLARGVCSGVLEQVSGTPKHMSHQMLLYDRFGQNTYVVGPMVQDLFRRTELSKVTPDMVIPPQTAFYIALDSCPWRLWGGDRTRWHQVSGVYVSFVDALESKEDSGKPERGIHIFIWGDANERSVNEADDAALWFSLNLEKWIREGEDLESFFDAHAVMAAHRDGPKDWTGVDVLDPLGGPMIPGGDEEMKEQRKVLVNVLRLVLNLCLYVGSDGPELEIDDQRDEIEKLKAQIRRKKAPGKRKKMERRLATMPRTRVVYVGPTFEQMELDRQFDQLASGGSHRTPVEHAVRPHWQHYWVGSGEDRRRIWRHKSMYRRGTGSPDRTIVKIRE
jgi:hypothetical protein